MPAQSANGLLDQLRHLRLVPDGVVMRVDAEVVSRAVADHERLPQLLAQLGLTGFQIRVVLNGQAERLLFGPYVLLDKLGEGGMGVVYKARHVRLGRIDALKVLRSDKLKSKTLAQRFLREIRLTSSLEHPHIVRAYDAGVVGQHLYLATEYVQGIDLATHVHTHGPLTLADTCLAMYHTALALQHVHEKGLVHRDLKPSNLIRDEATGAVKLLDLGLSGFSRAMLEPDSDPTLTHDGVLLGTPDYMAPEQVHNPHTVDIRADLYSLGCTAYFLLTGRPPYDGTPVEKMYYHGFAPIPSLRLRNGSVPPPGLSDILTRLMAKKPEERYATPQALVSALLALRPGTAAMSHEMIPSATTRLARRTNPIPVGTPLVTETTTHAKDATAPFDQFLSRTESARDRTGFSTDQSRSPTETTSGWESSGLLVAGAVLLFGIGFLATALLVGGR